MGNAARAWAFAEPVKPASLKFVLVAMADLAAEDLCFATVATLASLTSLDRKTVLRNLARLQQLNFIEDTGRRAGKTKSVIVYRLNTPSSTENGTAKQSQKRDSFNAEAVPLFPGSSTTFSRKQSQKRDTEQKGTERNISKRKKFVPPTVGEVSEYCQKRGNGIDPQGFVDYYASQGWMRGKTKIRDWRACVRTWERRSANQAQTATPDKRREF